MVDFAEGTEGSERRPSSRRRNLRAARSGGVLVLVAVVVVFVIQNSQRVTVRFWFVTGHAPLIWVIVVCLAGAAAFGFVVGRRSRRRRSRRSSAD